MTEPTPTLPEMVIDQSALQDYRVVLQYFRTNSTAVATVDELARNISDQQDEAQRHAATRLHHVTLPRLVDAGFICYDARSNTARYRRGAQGDRLTEEAEG